MCQRESHLAGLSLSVYFGVYWRSVLDKEQFSWQLLFLFASTPAKSVSDMPVFLWPFFCFCSNWSHLQAIYTQAIDWRHAAGDAAELEKSVNCFRSDSKRKGVLILGASKIFRSQNRKATTPGGFRCKRRQWISTTQARCKSPVLEKVKQCR